MDLIVKVTGRQCKFCAPSYSAIHKLLAVAIATCIEWLHINAYISTRIPIPKVR